MGADFIYAWVPSFDATTDRLNRLDAIIQALGDDDCPDWESNIGAWKGRLNDALEAMDPTRRDVSLLRLPGADYEVLLSGGMSYGEEPTEACTAFSDIGECRDLFREMEEFAREDALKHKRPPTSSIACSEGRNEFEALSENPSEEVAHG